MSKGISDERERRTTSIFQISEGSSMTTTVYVFDFNRLEVYEAGALLSRCWHILMRAMKRKVTFTRHFVRMRSEPEAR
jgi:hypothetical protein